MQKILEIGLGKGKKRQNLAFRSGGIVSPSACYTTFDDRHARTVGPINRRAYPSLAARICHHIRDLIWFTSCTTIRLQADNNVQKDPFFNTVLPCKVSMIGMPESLDL